MHPETIKRSWEIFIRFPAGSIKVFNGPVFGFGKIMTPLHAGGCKIWLKKNLPQVREFSAPSALGGIHPFRHS
jgi:hypothetical protein